MTGPLVAEAIGGVLAEWRRTGYYPPPPADELLVENHALTAALHANHCHPDFTYAITTGATALPPSARFGSGWEPNVDHPQHGWGRKPSSTSWMWRRPLDQEQP